MNTRGFTFIEVILSIFLIIIISAIVYSALDINSSILKSIEVRANVELSRINDSLFLYYKDEHSWPADVSRGFPSGLEAYLGDGDWPKAPFNDVSEYDWDNFTGSDGNQVLQISIRFCPLGQPSQCQFPDADWAENFDYYSSYYFCIQGICKAHPDKPDDHPGYCVNCR